MLTHYTSHKHCSSSRLGPNCFCPDCLGTVICSMSFMLTMRSFWIKIEFHFLCKVLVWVYCFLSRLFWSCDMQHELFMLTMRRSYWIVRSCIVVVRVFSFLEVTWGGGLVLLHIYLFKRSSCCCTWISDDLNCGTSIHVEF